MFTSCARMNLTIKGTVEEATAAASERGIHLENVKRLETWNSVSAQTDAEVATVARWFGETGEAPYPAGTLLLYGFVK